MSRDNYKPPAVTATHREEEEGEEVEEARIKGRSGLTRFTSDAVHDKLPVLASCTLRKFVTRNNSQHTIADGLERSQVVGAPETTVPSRHQSCGTMSDVCTGDSSPAALGLAFLSSVR